MGNQRLPKFALKSSHAHLRLNRGWYKNAMTRLHHRGIDGNVTLQNIDNIKNIVTYKIIEKMLDKKEIEVKIKLRYYKEVINPNLEDQKYLSILTSLKKKINITKIRTNSHELHYETRH